MQGELNQVANLVLFARIVQAGGISRCAAELGMERTTVSRRLGNLEQTLGVKLLDRSPKHISVTAAGRRCLEQCELLLESAQNAQSQATTGAFIANTTPLVVGAPPDILSRYLEPRLAEFESDNSSIRIERRPVTVWTEEAVESVDIGITLTPLKITAGWTKTIAHLRQSIFASADYVAQNNPVSSPFDLESHDCIVESSDSEKHSWSFKRSDKVTTVTVNSKYVVSSLLEAREGTLAGLGICRLPQYLCESYLKSGQLVDVLPDMDSVGREVSVISPRQRKNGAAALRIHLETAFNGRTI